MAAISITELTTAALNGTGAFDVLMRANKAHLESEFDKGRIKGTEYSTVYLGSLESVMRTALEFTIQSRKVALEAQLLEQQIFLAQAEIRKADAQIDLTKQQTANAVIEATVLTAQECKLRAEYDLVMSQTMKSTAENDLLVQKVVTEKAQTQSIGVDQNSVVGKQNALYSAQTLGFTRDSEQKVAKMMIDSWNVRRTTDEGTEANGTNMLNDSTVGRAINKMLSGIGA